MDKGEGLADGTAGWVSLSLSQAGLAWLQSFHSELLGPSAQAGFIHKRPACPGGQLAWGKVGSHKLAAPISLGSSLEHLPSRQDEAPGSRAGCAGVGTRCGDRSSPFLARAAPPPCAHPTPAQICFSSKQPAPPLRLQMAQEGHDPDVSPCLSAHDATANTWVRSAPGCRKPLRDRGAGADATAVLRMRGRECRPRPLCRGTAVHLPPPPLTALGGGRNDRPQAAAHPQVPGTSQRTRGMVLVNWTRHGTTVHQRFLQKGEGKD